MAVSTAARLVLPVRQYYVQTDSQVPGQAYRMCFSSTCAMAVKYLMPDALKGANADDTYLHTVRRYGDSTSSQAQTSACADYGVVAHFSTTGDRALLEQELRSGYPVATGFLHHGPSSAPRGGGHWILAIGYEPGAGVFNDPYGELDNRNGGYVRVGSGGQAVAYSWRHWLPRWEVEGSGSGWCMTFRRADGLPSPEWQAIQPGAQA
jgi:Peptidase_C39 like family